MFLGIDRQKKNLMAALDDNGTSITYGELSCFSDEFNKAVPERAIIFCLCENSIGSLAGYTSCISNRVVPLLLGSSIDRGLLSQLMETYEPAYMWIPKRYHSEFNFPIILSKFEYILIKTEYKMYPINEKLSLLLTTSGSTGSPKLVRHKYGNIESNAKNVSQLFGWTSEERAVVDLPMQYTMGLNVINSHLYVGATVLLTNYNLMSNEFWSFIKEQKATNFTGVPFSFEVLLRLRFTKMDLPYLTTIAEGGGKLSEKMFKEIADYANRANKRFFATFGTTETSARLAYLPHEMALTKSCSIGKAIPEGEMFLLDSDGNEIIGNNVEGELGYRGPNVTMGYAKSKEDLLKGDEWQGEYHTGDIARRDEDGYYFIIGRKSRFLKLYGLRVSLDHCENLIKTNFNIDCACTGTDKRMEIYITDVSYKEEVQKYISEKTGIYMNAFNVNIIDDIPRNTVNKVDYVSLLNS
ncbi:AMP-binding protein [Heyndrickxia sporothermodurans]|uniref:AMP-binding protein n=1 Tax=Heyndrickxia sporothermodurans TaxID=46224 RepID=UPI002E225989|nr:AMP-binding protein [Heyndrickxia sporothermodurans]